MISSPIVTRPDADEADTPVDQGEADTPLIDLRCVSHDDTLLVRLVGEVDHFAAAPLRVVLAAAAVYGYRHLALDTRAVTFCDSALARALAGWCRRGRRGTHTAMSRAVGLALERGPGRRKAPGAWRVTGR
ncbi:STAS domain-containing protein [Streptomyces sp. NPDC004111]|uniref:STAS domain-containing protein n=1 Tax=Streptomyces sp. NPDC004111 TaxID=3364690 RepID=UPI0036CD57AF